MLTPQQQQEANGFRDGSMVHRGAPAHRQRLNLVRQMQIVQMRQHTLVQSLAGIPTRATRLWRRVLVRDSLPEASPKMALEPKMWIKRVVKLGNPKIIQVISDLVSQRMGKPIWFGFEVLTPHETVRLLQGPRF